MATLIDKLVGKNLGEFDAGIDIGQFRGALKLILDGDLTAAEIVTAYGLDQTQSDELDELIAAAPAGAADRVAWLERVAAIFEAGYANGQVGWAGFETTADARTAIGLT